MNTATISEVECRGPDVADEPTCPEERFLLAEYEALRAEIMRRHGRRAQIVYGSIFGLPLIPVVIQVIRSTTQINIITSLFAILPMLVLVAVWLYISENNGIKRIGRYIREEIESRFSGLTGWESWLEQHDSGAFGKRFADIMVNVAFIVISVTYFIAAVIIYWYEARTFIININELIASFFITLYAIGAIVTVILVLQLKYRTRES